MRATDLLRHQHRQIESLFARIEAGHTASLPDLASALAAHMAVEHELMYPEARETDEAAVAASFEEHAIAEVALKRVLATAPSDEAFEARVRVLKELVMHHVQLEERNLFREIEAEMSPEDLCAMGEVLQRRFDELHRLGYAALLSPSPHQTAADLAQAAVAA